MGPAAQQNLKALASQLGKEVLENPEPLPKTSRDLLEELKDVKISIEILESTRIGKTLNKAIKSFKRHKRTAADDSIVREWEELIESSEELLRTWKATVDNEAKQQAKKKKSGGIALQDKAPFVAFLATLEPTSTQIFQRDCAACFESFFTHRIVNFFCSNCKPQ